jgi:hypothetical protein
MELLMCDCNILLTKHYLSLGNLAYHYQTKDIIVQVLYEALTKRQATLLAQYRVTTAF